MLKALVAHLRENKQNVVKTVDFRGEVYDPTYGWQSRMMEIETVDFDALLREIDEFADTFKGLTGDA